MFDNLEVMLAYTLDTSVSRSIMHQFSFVGNSLGEFSYSVLALSVLHSAQKRVQSL